MKKLLALTYPFDKISIIHKNNLLNLAIHQGDQMFLKKLPKDNIKLPKKLPNRVFVRFTI